MQSLSNLCYSKVNELAPCFREQSLEHDSVKGSHFFRVHRIHMSDNAKPFFGLHEAFVLSQATSMFPGLGDFVASKRVELN